MGYNLFNIVEVPKTFNRKLNDFRSSLAAAISEGKDITFADNDITYALKLQHDRLTEKGLRLDYDVYSRGENEHNGKFIAGSNWKDAHYESTVCFSRFGIKRKVKKDGKIRYSDDVKSVLYETITDVVTGAHPDNDPFCCPSCGAISTVAGLQNGCEYCGTRFQMDDLFPKVTSYYFLEEPGMTKGEFKSGYLKFYLGTIIVTYLLGCILNGAVFLPQNLLKSIPSLIGVVLGLGLGSIVVGYVFYAYFLFMRLIVKAIANAGKMGTAGSRRSFELRMKKVSPEFSYEYFTSKALSLIKTAIFSGDEQELLFYEGGPLDPKMKDIIDLNYGGALGCKSFHDEGNFVTVVTKAYFDVLYADEKGIRAKSQVFSATFKRRTDIPVSLNFSMTRIECPSCGASFDATKNKNCPYCGTK
ncbi:MAG: zinc ribbon domain-containing protein [Lachnospiraceae bacterium]|nr:zinc ribbon domain-containing protein [Lachnospiraceae bacterium]